eukprot:scaffold34221_cov101-Isochrysis_galbana.AAC.4
MQAAGRPPYEACFKAVLKAHPTVYGWLIGHMQAAGLPPLESHSPVGECLVGRQASGMAVERCVGLGVGRVGSVGLPGFCVVIVM